MDSTRKRRRGTIAAVLGVLLTVSVTLGMVPLSSAGTESSNRQAIKRSGPRATAHGRTQIMSNAERPTGDVMFRALRRTSNAADAEFAAATAPSIRDVIARNHLDLSAARSVFSGPDGTAGLIPGPEVLCFVSNSELLGTVSSCLPPEWAASHGGFGFVGGGGGTTLVQGLAPDHVTAVHLTLAGGAIQSLPLNGANVYSASVASAPSQLSLYSGSRLIRRTAIAKPELPPAP